MYEKIVFAILLCTNKTTSLDQNLNCIAQTVMKGSDGNSPSLGSSLYNHARSPKKRRTQHLEQDGYKNSSFLLTPRTALDFI